MITGASDGCGEAMAYQLARAGFNIIIVSRSEQKMEKVQEAIHLIYDKKCVCIKYDFSKLANAGEAEKLEKILDRNLDKIDVGVLVNNVGNAWFGDFHTMPFKVIFQLMSVNCAS